MTIQHGYPKMPCGLCQSLKRPAEGTSAIAKADFTDLVQFAANCQICELLLAIVKDATLISNEKFELHLEHSGYHMLKIHCSTLSERPQVVEIHFLPYEDLQRDQEVLDELNANNRSKYEGVRSPFTDSDSSFEWAQSRLNDCSGHAFCTPVQPSRLPDRLLSLNLGGANQDVRLHVSDGEIGVYVSLSHCWGGHLPIMLTQANLSSFQQNIPFSALPKTFLDAITFTRRLGVPYLWIDSLCIIQDSPTDWAQQSAQMASIYANSYLNLAASSALDGRDGLFTSHRPSLNGYITTLSSPSTHTPIPTSLSNLPPPPSTPKTTFIIKEWTPSSHPDYTFTAALSNPGLCTTLSGRGWVYQERLLSPRTLHFGHTDLRFECNTHISCQCGTWRHSGSRQKGAAFPKFMHGCALKGVATGDGEEKVLRYRWQRIASEFSSMAVTYESDKLPALAGIARQFWERRPELQYAMGCWREWMVEHLIWHTVTYRLKVGRGRWEGAPRREDEKGRRMPPSWSWASVGNAVQFEMEDPGSGTVASFEVKTERDPVVVSVPGEGTEHDVLLGRAEGELVIRGHLTETRMRRYKTAEGMEYGVTRYDGREIYRVRLDSLPEDDTAWNDCDPRWMERPAADPGRHVSYEWWEKEKRLSQEDLMLLDYQNSPLKYWRETCQSCEEFAEPVWCLFMKFWDGTHAYHISLVLRRVAESPEKFARIGLLLYNPSRLPVYQEGDVAMRDVILV